MFERALAVGGEPSPVALSNLATMYFEAGRYAEAVTTFQRSLSVNDDDHRVWGYLGWSYAAGVDPERAAEPFERAAELGEEALVDDPEDAHLLAMVAGYHGMLGDRGRGFDLVERAIALDPQDPDVMATIGETLEDLGDRERALTWIARALRNGARRDRLETHPSLRALVADDRYKQLVSEADPAAVGDAS
jgi:tetratricopeptide (TPR) repeat protein